MKQYGATATPSNAVKGTVVAILSCPSNVHPPTFSFGTPPVAYAITSYGGNAGTGNSALTSTNGKPTPNPLRDTAFQASALRTSLYTSVMAFNLSDLVVGLGLMIVVLGLAVGGMGVALAGLAIPTFAQKLHVEPVAAAH